MPHVVISPVATVDDVPVPAPTGLPAMQRRWVATAFLAVLGGWLIVMPGAVVALSLRFAEVDPDNAPLTYSVTLGAGWLVLVVALVAFGRVSDRLRQRGRSRARILLGAIPVAVLCAAGLGTAGSVVGVAVLWMLAQAAAAAIVAPSLALVGDVVPTHRRGWASAVAGALSTIALFIGVLVVRVFSVSSAVALAATVLLGGLIAIPLLLARGVPETPAPTQPDPSPTSTNDRRWTAFIVSTLLVAWCISTGNSYVVLFIDRVSTVAQDQVASTATSLVAMATAVALVGTAVGGALSRSRGASVTTYSVAAVGAAVSVVIMVLRPTPSGLLVGALLFGLSAGVFQGAQLAVALFVRRADGPLGHDLGVLNAAASLPHVLVPAVAALAFTVDVTDGLRWMFVGSGLLALAGAVLLSTMLRTTRGSRAT